MHRRHHGVLECLAAGLVLPNGQRHSDFGVNVNELMGEAAFRDIHILQCLSAHTGQQQPHIQLVLGLGTSGSNIEHPGRDSGTNRPTADKQVLGLHSAQHRRSRHHHVHLIVNLVHQRRNLALRRLQCRHIRHHTDRAGNINGRSIHVGSLQTALHIAVADVNAADNFHNLIHCCFLLFIQVIRF